MKFKSGDRVAIINQPRWHEHLATDTSGLVGREGVVLAVPTVKPGSGEATFDNSTYRVHVEGAGEFGFSEDDLAPCRSFSATVK